LFAAVLFGQNPNFLKKIRTLNFDCCASRGRAENFSAQAGREEKKGGENAPKESPKVILRGKNSHPVLAWKILEIARSLTNKY